MVPVLTFLLTLCIILGFSLPSNTQKYKDFKKKHILQINCNQIIDQRNIWINNNKNCKPLYTFIDANVIEVQKMCQGIVESDHVLSEGPLHLTVCSLIKEKSAKPPNCFYNEGHQNKRINITCENNLPVHFNRWALFSTYGAT
uniref:Ribonuclease A-domain domain-containing protein n=1 Tax=Xenopus tropicalis TaxID=8364 RepID=A0A6I8SGN9_XENTR